MKFSDLVVEMTVADLASIQQQIVNLFAAADIEVLFTQHFGDRSIDGSLDEYGVDRGSQIRPKPLLIAMRKLLSVVVPQLPRTGKEVEGVVSCIDTKYNIPFVWKFSRRTSRWQLYFKTIKKKTNFKSHDPGELHYTI
jgi:hypothetical protein